MKNILTYFRLCLFAALYFAPGSQACTAFSLPTSYDKIVAKSYDWTEGHGMVIANPRGLKKSAIVLDPGAKAASWKSLYGSLTFNQSGREFPVSGMNEKGLIVEALWLSSTQTSNDKTLPELNELQWIQYQLDNYSSLEEVKQNAEKIRVHTVYAAVHYFVCDATGECGAFEFLSGKLVQSAATALANNTFAESNRYLKALQSSGRPIPTSGTSLDRFARAVSLAAAHDPVGGDARQDAFDILDSVGGTSFSKFHLVYNPTAKVAYFRTRAARKIKTVDLTRIAWDCSATSERALIYDMDLDVAGDVTASFEEYSESENLRMIQKSLKRIEDHLPAGLDLVLSRYPATLSCE